MPFHPGAPILKKMRTQLAATVTALTVALAPALARAAASVQPLSAANSSVAGGEIADFSARFLDGQGKPVVGETVQFANDACGYFPNGTFTHSTLTDANGVASARFTAFGQGIACYVTATDGAQARFYVITYLPEYTDVVADIPPRIVPGQSYDFTASVLYGSFKLPNVDIAASIVSGTSGASVYPQGGGTGNDGTTTFTVTPDAKVGDYQIDPRDRREIDRDLVL